MGQVDRRRQRGDRRHRLYRSRSIPFSQDPYNTHPEKGPSAFDVTHSFNLSVAQDLHLEKVGLPRPVSKKSPTDGNC